jgi:hypothetical protein
MQEFAPQNTTTLAEDCPSAEDLAAYIDGTLDAKEGARVTDHLASCGECYAVYMESLRFELESRPAEPVGVVDHEIARFRPKEAGGARRYASNAVRWLSIAALLLCGVGTGTYFEFLAPPSGLVTAEVTPPLPSLPNGAEPMWLGATYRGGESDEEVKAFEASFRMGVQLVNLRATLRAGKKSEAEDVIARILGLLTPQPFSEDLQKGFKGITNALESGKPPGVQGGEHHPFLRLAKREHASYALVEAIRLGEIYRKDFEPGSPFDFGQWIEAGHLAAQSRDPSFFQWDVSRAFLRRLLWRDKLHDLLRIDDPKLDPDTRKNLDRIAEVVAKGDFRTADYGELTRNLEEILKRYYPDR